MSTVGESVSKWGEGPVWSEDVLWWVDIEGRAVCRRAADGGEVRWDVGQRVGCALPQTDGRWLCAGDHGFFAFNPQDGACRALADPEAGQPDNRFNDGKVAPDGRAFAGSISLKKQAGTAALYRMDADGAVTRILDGLTNSNGMAWSADGGTVYHIDTPRRNVRAFDYADGRFSAERVVIDTSAHEGAPDGMCIDDAGNLWIAFCRGGAVMAFDPRSGKPLERVALPCKMTTSVCFGGEGHADLYVTTGLGGGGDERLAGRLFVVRGTGARGRAVDKFTPEAALGFGAADATA